MKFLKALLALLADVPPTDHEPIRTVKVPTEGPEFETYESDQRILDGRGWRTERIRFVEVPIGSV